MFIGQATGFIIEITTISMGFIDNKVIWHNELFFISFKEEQKIGMSSLSEFLVSVRKKLDDKSTMKKVHLPVL